MKNLLPLFAKNYRLKLILGCLFSCLMTYSQDDIMSLRIMTYNIRHGEGMDNVIDLDRQAEVIRNATPDVVGLQEVDSVVKRSGYIPEAAVLGEKVGMYATFGPAIPLTKGKYGVAILSKEAPMSVRNIPLPGAEKRTLLVCEFQEYVFACTHLDLEEENRLASLDIILEEVTRWEKPFFICGDWNDQPGSTLITKMKKNFSFLNNLTANSSNYTFPANSPNRIIDYIASYGAGSNRVFKSIRKRQVINEPEVSDHRPVLVEITMDRYTTGISSLFEDGNSLQDEGICDLSGRRVQKAQKGIYIVGGKKILIR
jgi:endonuclease/exonuclease/phosphatase family metal-dependent hydrolase